MQHDLVSVCMNGTNGSLLNGSSHSPVFVLQCVDAHVDDGGEVGNYAKGVMAPSKLPTLGSGLMLGMWDIWVLL